MTAFDQHLLQTYLDRFCNRTDVFAQQFWTDDTYWYEPMWQPVTVDLIAAHLSGEFTAGWFCLSSENTCKWLCFDFDGQSGQREKLATVLRAHRWSIVLEGSRPGRDGHLWLFFDAAIPASLLRQFAKAFLSAAGISEKSVEIFPKQDRVVKLGSSVRGPLGIHHKPGADNVRGWFDIAEHDLNSQLEWFAAQDLNSSQRLLDSAEELDRRNRAEKLVRAARHSSRHRTKDGTSRIDWCEYAEQNNFRRSGDYWHGPCPACRSDGHDSTGDHLWVHASGAVGCWRGCAVTDIFSAVR